MWTHAMGLIGAGFLLGVQHSLDPDHLAAVSTIVGHDKGLHRPATAGAVWGLGHTLVLFVAGVLTMVLEVAIPEALARTFECIVGVMLLCLGGRRLKRVFAETARPARGHLRRPFFVGIVHGLAGSAGIVLLLIATMSSAMEGVLFTLVFGIGSVLGMMVSGTIISLPFRASARFARLNASIAVIAAITTIAIGLRIVRDNWTGVLWAN